MVPSTAQYRLFDLQMEGRFAQVLAEYRRQGLSSEEVSRRLYAEHGMEVSGQTLRNWFRQLDEADIEVA